MNLLTKDDFPTFGLPIKAINPDRKFFGVVLLECIIWFLNSSILFLDEFNSHD